MYPEGRVVTRRTRVKQRLSQELWTEQDGRCFWCDGDLTIHSSNGTVFATDATLDHWPISACRDGKLVKDNAVLACRACNNNRENKWKWPRYIEHKRRYNENVRRARERARDAGRDRGTDGQASEPRVIPSRQGIEDQIKPDEGSHSIEAQASICSGAAMEQEARDIGIGGSGE